MYDSIDKFDIQSMYLYDLNLKFMHICIHEFLRYATLAPWIETFHNRVEAVRSTSCNIFGQYWIF